jgi:outer membrane protein insertion porin family/translocation and assembly module TamA
LLVTVAYSTQIEKPFNYVDVPPVALSTVVIAYPSIVTTLDLRDDPQHPHKGIYLSDEFQVAGGPFGGEVADLRVQPEVRTYLPLGKRVTFATRASIGLLFARNYAQNFEGELRSYQNNPANLPPNYVSDLEKMYFRGFFSGGPNSNRGFPIRGVAPYGDVPFLNPATASQQVANSCLPSATGVVPPGCSSPIGGFTLWEFSNELRVDVSGPFSTAVFCDMSDVSPKQWDFRTTPLRPHMSCGFGVRYDTPVGPIRLDLGYRIESLQVLGYKNDVAANAHDPTEGIVPRLWGLPLAIAFGIGEAY